ncbi:MAG TPA: hypothetical protein VLS89_19275 [Candidatus Nanopelagicales bacterium]|nr:hypothetical protein [Candidatus Nanopelagicales bacterium]
MTVDEIRTAYPLPAYNYRVEINGEAVAFSEVSSSSAARAARTGAGAGGGGGTSAVSVGIAGNARAAAGACECPERAMNSPPRTSAAQAAGS